MAEIGGTAGRAHSKLLHQRPPRTSRRSKPSMSLRLTIHKPGGFSSAMRGRASAWRSVTCVVIVTRWQTRIASNRLRKRKHLMSCRDADWPDCSLLRSLHRATMRFRPTRPPRRRDRASEGRISEDTRAVPRGLRAAVLPFQTVADCELPGSAREAGQHGYRVGQEINAGASYTASPIPVAGMYDLRHGTSTLTEPIKSNGLPLAQFIRSSLP
ncbi:hypothetical protein BN2476_600037 [Paraburkholderia piptadeniae]|uniref:Uncharacterized protein n=1 Tax=Paraburkholderia piptadeniae TaxID=1701573 RepID=A0A1N7SK99_9BURK|nr:hypothetical protein BN2476_600037 [Paraburkholderia piptadeniae]